jgi:rhodanese-related sulfurtransferase/predicted RNA-binding Zn-ribbon protein involved in translation (DUF1610 family)
MKTFLFFLILAFSVSIALAQTKEYVCSPCGLACDNVVHTKPGTCPSCHMALVEKKGVKFENLSADEFCKRITSRTILLDVRTPAEFKGDAATSYGHFKNAININVEELEKRMAELEKYKDREILVYCSHSRRSPRAAIMLTDHGFKNVKNLAGGVSTLHAKGNACLEGNFIAHK